MLVAGAEGWGFARLFLGGLLLFLGERTVFWSRLWVSGVLEGSFIVSFGVQKVVSST